MNIDFCLSLLCISVILWMPAWARCAAATHSCPPHMLASGTMCLCLLPVCALTSAYHRSPPLTTAHHLIPPLTTAHHRSPLLATAHHCSPLLATARHCSPLDHSHTLAMMHVCSAWMRPSHQQHTQIYSLLTYLFGICIRSAVIFPIVALYWIRVLICSWKKICMSEPRV